MLQGLLNLEDWHHLTASHGAGCSRAWPRKHMRRDTSAPEQLGLMTGNGIVNFIYLLSNRGKTFASEIAKWTRRGLYT